MSTSTTVEVTRRSDGGYTAVDEETGAKGEGSSRAEALEDLAFRLQHRESWEHETEASDPALSEDSLERIEKSEEEFERGDYVKLDDP